MIPCDLCGNTDPRPVLESPQLDGPLVACGNCGLRYVGKRRSSLAFGAASSSATAERLEKANTGIRHLRLEEEHRLAVLNARWRLSLIHRFARGGRLLEVGCARGDFLQVARESFEVFGVEPNPDLAAAAAPHFPIHQDIVETLPWGDFDVAASFHVIEHVDSPRRFISAIAGRMRPGGLLAIETPDIDSITYRVMGRRWRQFIPEHYFFFDKTTIGRLLTECGFRILRIDRIGKHASLALILNRLARYYQPLRHVEDAANSAGLSRLTMRINPRDILIVFATRDFPRKNAVG